MKNISRRQAIEAISAGAAMSFAGLATTAAQTPTAALANKAFAGQHKPKPLPFDAAKLKGLSERMIKSHWENNYGGAVGALNIVEQRLAALMAEKDAPAYLYGDLKREELVRTGSVVLHEYYFANLGGDGKAGGDILTAIKQAWGSYEMWETEFKRTGQSLAGGSGWALLGYNLHTGELHNYWAWDHMHNAPTALPLLALDMYEHSYHIDYGSAAAKYVAAFMENVNWEEVNRRYVKAQKAASLLAGA